MKTALILALCLATATAYTYTTQEQEFLWEAFRIQHNKKYSNAFEAMQRFQIFKDNLEAVTAHNADPTQTYTMGMNQFGDMTNAEYKKTMLGFVKPTIRRSRNFAKLSTVGLPTTVNWEQKGAVTPVKNQGQCGSCWSFSTTGSVEGITEIKTGKLISLSEQQLMDCSTAEGDKGCNGGLMDDAFKYIIKNGGIGSEASYPYQGVQGTCKSVPSVATISGYTNVEETEAALEAAVAQQPVSIAIEADQLGFQFYMGGVFSGSCGTNLDHGVLVVGYGNYEGKPYWQVKNSWGASWGDSGYILLAKGLSQKGGQCGLLLSASYPTKN